MHWTEWALHCSQLIPWARLVRFCFCVAFYFFSFSDKSAACFALAGLLKRSLGWVVQQCDINCCNDTNCNTNVTILSQNATNVLRRDGKECLPLSLIWDCSVEHRLNFPSYKISETASYPLKRKNVSEQDKKSIFSWVYWVFRFSSLLPGVSSTGSPIFSSHPKPIKLICNLLI